MQNNYSSSYDLIIIGAGLVGNSLALALADTAKVAIIEANAADIKAQLTQIDLVVS